MQDGRDLIVPIIDEQAEVKTRAVEREQVRLHKSVTTRTELVDPLLLEEEITVERVPVGRVVEAAAAPRQEGDTLVVPVYEERLVLEKRLVLREEIRLTRVRRERREPQQVELRREEIEIERTRPEPAGGRRGESEIQGSRGADSALRSSMRE